MEKILVTGGYGFIGSNFLHYLKKFEDKNTEVINVDCLTYAGRRENLDGLIYNTYEEDICSKEIKNIFEKERPSYVINFAAESHVDNSINSPMPFVKTNVVGTANLLDLSYKYGVKRFLQVSTDEVYGSTEKGSFTEKSQINPSSPYSASKASADHLVLSYHKTFNMDVCITRCSNNYGPRQHEEKLIPQMIKRALNEEFLPVYGNGLNVRDWIHVNDHCRAVYAVLLDGKKGEVYNVGSFNEVTNIDIVKKILKFLKKPNSLIKYVEDRKGHDKRYSINSVKLCNELMWTPIVDFNTGLEETIKWYMRFWKK